RFEDVASVSRRTLMRGNLFDWFVDSAQLRETLAAVTGNEISTARFDGTIKRAPVVAGDTLPVHVIVTQIEHLTDRVLVEMLEIEQQTRQDREERALGHVQANKELIRNLAHEIKNPLGGIRGAAQLLELEIGYPPGHPEDGAPVRGPSAEGEMEAARRRELTEYTQVIIHEADRLQALVDRLLAPHRKPHVVSDVNIHEVCERVRSLIMAEFPRGLAVQRDYDTSIPDFRGDREQLIQAVLNIAHNAAHALGERIAGGDARLVLRTRVARQVTIGKQRFRLALELHIEDNGPGVAEDIRDRIFYPLVSGREGGSGLGLTLAQTFVQQHSGTIECDSVSGRTVFRIVIPLP
ncbi:MAG: PAS domain-containing sensor histidine kinase, partial [Betaproteobacteria bacterium]|nr:PAS domain-containing sensor histidine kinase [Betaproteobacteria bacterium]